MVYFVLNKSLYYYYYFFGRYPLPEIITECINLYYHSHKCKRHYTKASKTKESKQVTLSSTTVETVYVPDVGKFTAYLDGRVNIVFDDRTILEIPDVRQDERTLMCNILDSHGENVIVRIQKPLQYIKYVHLLLLLLC